MKYLTLIEILKAILYFFLGGISSKIGWSLAKFAFMFLREMLSNLRHSFASALKYPSYSKNKNIKESRAGKFALEFLFTSLICVFFLLSSYALLDGQLRLFSVACFALGMWFAELLIRRVKNFALVFAFHFVSFFGKIFHVFF